MPVTTDTPRMVAVKDIKVGDMLDLAADKYADPLGMRIEFECEYVTVCEVIPETPGCIALGFEGIDVFGFPPDHLLKVHGHDEGYDDE